MQYNQFEVNYDYSSLKREETMRQYNFGIHPLDQQKIVIFQCFSDKGFPKNGIALAKLTSRGIPWEYYQNNNTWLHRGYDNTAVYDTKEEAELACTQHLNFLKECGYV